MPELQPSETEGTKTVHGLMHSHNQPLEQLEHSQSRTITTEEHATQSKFLFSTEYLQQLAESF